MPRRLLPGRLGGVEFDGELPTRDGLGRVFDELDFQMACQAYVWALPLVAFAQWQQQHRDVFGASSLDLVRYLSYRDKLGLITANATTPYVVMFLDLMETGPVVIELPAGSMTGGVSDFWQRELAVIGELGPDGGNGGKHLIVPPGQSPFAPAGFFTTASTGMNVMLGLRTLEPNPERARALVDAVRIYPYAQRDNPPPTRVISPDGRDWSAAQPRGLVYWERLHDIYQRETIDERDRFYLAMLRQLGIEKHKPFDPDPRTREILQDAAAAGELMAQANTFAKRFPNARYWPDRQWDQAIVLDNRDQRDSYFDELLERASWFYEAVGVAAALKSQTPGVGQAYLSAYADARGEWLDGGRDYILRVPADPPAQLLWSATVYDIATRCLIDNDQQRGDRGSRDPDLVTNADASVDLYFGPNPPADGEANWVPTIPGRHWFAYFRLYGPLAPYFDRTWKLGDITPR